MDSSSKDAKTLSGSTQTSSQRVSGGATRYSFNSLRGSTTLANSKNPGYAARMLKNGATPTSIMSERQIMKVIRRGLEYISATAEDSDAIKFAIIGFATINHASDRVFENENLDETIQIYKSDGTMIEVETLPFFNYIFENNLNGKLRPFCRAFVSDVKTELSLAREAMHQYFGITDPFAARSDLLPKNFVTDHKFEAKRLTEMRDKVLSESASGSD